VAAKKSRNAAKATNTSNRNIRNRSWYTSVRGIGARLSGANRKRALENAIVSPLWATPLLEGFGQRVAWTCAEGRRLKSTPRGGGLGISGRTSRPNRFSFGNGQMVGPDKKAVCRTKSGRRPAFAIAMGFSAWSGTFSGRPLNADKESVDSYQSYRAGWSSGALWRVAKGPRVFWAGGFSARPWELVSLCPVCAGRAGRRSGLIPDWAVQRRRETDPLDPEHDQALASTWNRSCDQRRGAEEAPRRTKKRPPAKIGNRLRTALRRWRAVDDLLRGNKSALRSFPSSIGPKGAL